MVKFISTYFLHTLTHTLDLPEGILPGNVDAFRKKQFLFKFGIDRWYSHVKEHTFPTTCLSLTPQEGFHFSSLFLFL